MADSTYEIIDSNDEQTDIVATNYGQQAFTITPVEDTIIVKAINGDEKAFEKLFMGTYRYVFAAIRKYLKDDQDIYDAIQNTYMRVYKGLSRLESSLSFYPWLYRIATNCAKDILHENGQIVAVPFEDSTTSPDQSPDYSSEVTADVSEVLKQLPTEQAELLIRVYYDKMRVAEIARMQGVPVNTVHNRLKAAKKNLSGLLKIRGIDKPIYSGEFISMISTALRDAIGTQLLSIAIAEEILHSITGTKNKKGAFVVSTFARNMRNRAVKNIAAILLLTCLLTTTIVLFVVGIITRNLSGNEKNYGNSYDNSSTLSVTSHLDSSEDVTTSLEETVSSLPSITDITSSSTAPDTSSSNSLSSANSSTTSETIEEVVPKFLSSFESKENFGTFVEDGYLHIATSNNSVYAFVHGRNLYWQELSPYHLSSPITTIFGELYGESGCFMNVYGDKVYWINQNDDSNYVLNRCNLQKGTEHYYKVFDKTEYTFLSNLIVAKDGIYFLANSANDNSTTLYRTDYDFNVKDTISGVADYGIINDKIYYLYGNSDYGLLYSADRATFDNKTCVRLDNLNYGGISTIGEFLILEPSQQHNTNCIVIDTVANKIANTISVNPGDTFKLNDASDFEDGTIIYTLNGQYKRFNITNGEIKEFISYMGTMYNNYKFFRLTDSLFRSDIDGEGLTGIH